MRNIGNPEPVYVDPPKGYPVDTIDTGPAQSAKVPLTTEAILKERGSRYGRFEDNARVSQELSRIVRNEQELRTKRGQLPMTWYEMEALEMICHKIARVVSGNDTSYADNWDDIAGYAQLGKEPR